MKLIYLLLPAFLLLSCNKENELSIVIPPSDTITPPVDKPIPPSTLTQLNYPFNSGITGDAEYGLCGYGFDATGLFDEISAKAKVIDVKLLNPEKSIAIEQYSIEINGKNVNDFFSFLKQREISEVFPQHFKSLWKLAYNTEVIDTNYAISYYAFIQLHSRVNFNSSEPQAAISEEFKSNALSLSAEELVKKYGTHVLTSIMIGTKFESLYRSIPDSEMNTENINVGHYKRMHQFFGNSLSTALIDTTISFISKDEQIIYNTIGCKEKYFGLISATDNNSNHIMIDVYSKMNSFENEQLIMPGNGNESIRPLWEFIENQSKRDEVITFISNYFAEKNVEL